MGRVHVGFRIGTDLPPGIVESPVTGGENE